MRVEPEGAGLRRDKAIDIRLSMFDGILSDSGYAVRRIKAVDPMPVNGDAKGKMVHHGHYYQISLVYAQACRGCSIEGPRGNLRVRAEGNDRILSDEGELIHMRGS